MKPTFNDKLDEAKRILAQNQQTIQSKKTEVPINHWCGHYLDPTSHQVIPDGNKCCWWHWIGLPRRWGVRHPAYKWQEKRFKEYFEEHQRLFYEAKIPKIGASHTWLSIALHEACINPKWANGQVAIVVGTHGDEATKKIEYCKELLAVRDESGKIAFDEKGNMITKVDINQNYNNRKEFTINSVEFRAHPANNIDSIRSQPNMKMIIVDELAFFTIVDQQKVRDAWEHYLGGSEVVIVLITTTGNWAGGIAFDLENEKNGIYNMYFMKEDEGLEVHPESGTSLHRKEDLDLIRDTPSYNRNYRRMWGHGIGNIFPYDLLQLCTEEYDLSIGNGSKVLCVDPAYGSSDTSSKFGLVGFEMVNGIKYVKLAQQYARASPAGMFEIIKIEAKKFGNNVKVDSAHPGLIRDLRESGVNASDMNFNQELSEMVSISSQDVKTKKVRIHPTFRDLLNQLVAVETNEKGNPDKKKLKFDLGDAFIMGCKALNDGSGYSVVVEDRQFVEDD